jgi:hypothetical protein
MDDAERPIAVCYCYAHQDQTFRDELDRHLIPMRRAGHITTWSAGEILPGSEWDATIQTHLDTADLLVLLVSPDFLASGYCWSSEMPRALARHAAGTARVLPVIIRDADWESTPLKDLQVLPGQKKSIAKYPDRDEAWQRVTQGIRNVVAELRGSNGSTTYRMVPSEFDQGQSRPKPYAHPISLQREDPLVQLRQLYSERADPLQELALSYGIGTPHLVPKGTPLFQTQSPNYLDWHAPEQHFSLHNLGIRPAFNVASVLHGCESYRVEPTMQPSALSKAIHWTCWFAEAIEPGRQSTGVHRLGNGTFLVDQQRIGTYQLNAPPEPSPGAILRGTRICLARLIVTYHDDCGQKYASIGNYIQHLQGWYMEPVLHAIPEDLYDLETQATALLSSPYSR